MVASPSSGTERYATLFIQWPIVGKYSIMLIRSRPSILSVDFDSLINKQFRKYFPAPISCLVTNGFPEVYQY